MNILFMGDCFMKNSDSSIKKYKYLIIGTSLGLAVNVIMLLVMAIIFTTLDLDISYAHPMASIACGIGALVGGYISSKLCKSKGLINGILTGLFIFIIVMLISLLVSDGSVTLMSFIRLIITLSAASIGGILGVNKIFKKRII